MDDLTVHYRMPTYVEHDYTVQRLREHTEAQIGVPVTHIPFGLMAYDGPRFVGSAIGKIFLDWLHLDLIWVDETVRGQGLGRKLMESAAEKAREMGLKGIEVWTQSWQAPDFYRKLGYKELAELEDFTPGRKRHIFRKRLDESAA